MSDEDVTRLFCGRGGVRVMVVDEVTDPGCDIANVPIYATSCPYCGARGPMALSEDEAVVAWNRRAERTCRMVDCSTHDTCVVNRELCNGNVMSMEFGYRQCSDCGAYVFDCPTVRYCPSCGALVIGEETDMPTDDERREVARRLRELPDDSTYPDLIGAIADHDGWYAAADAADRLADLIEPSCDRDALLRLSDKVFEDTEEDMRAAGKSVPAFIAGQCLRDVASRIREALGVTS